MSAESFPNTQPPEEPLVTNDQEESKWDLYQIPPVDPRPPEEKLAAPLPYNGPVRSESSTIGKDKASDGHRMHVPFEGFYDIPTGLTTEEVVERTKQRPDRDDQVPQIESLHSTVTPPEQLEVQPIREKIEELRETILNIHEGDSSSSAEQGKEYYQKKYINFLEALRTEVREGKGSITHALDTLQSTDASLKSEIISDLQGADLIDNDGNIIADEIEIAAEHRLELIDALEHHAAIVGARYTFESGIQIEITEQQGEDTDAHYSVLTTTDSDSRKSKMIYKLTGVQLIEQLRTRK